MKKSNVLHQLLTRSMEFGYSVKSGKGLITGSSHYSTSQEQINAKQNEPRHEITNNVVCAISKDICAV